MPVVTTLAELRDAVLAADTEPPDVSFDPDAEQEAETALREAGVLLLGEYHGVAENAGIVRALVERLRIDAAVLEWPPALARVIGGWASNGELEDDRSLWLGDGRVTAEHVAMLGPLARAGVRIALIDRAIAATPGSRPDRDHALADAALEAMATSGRALVVAGNAHTPVAATEHVTPMGARIARARPGATEIRIEYGSGRFHNFGTHAFPDRFGDEERPRLRRRDAALELRLPRATEATVGQRISS